MVEDTSKGPSFKPEIGLLSLTALIIGSMVGSGVFFLPGSMLFDAGSANKVMLAWIGGAVIALAGGLTFAELGAAFPKAGGQYAFLRDSVGKLPAFLFSWTGFTVVQSGTIAAVAVAMANALNAFLVRVGVAEGLPGAATKWGAIVLPGYGVGLVAVGVVVLLTLLNYLGVKRAALVNNAATFAKMAAIIVLIVALFVLADGAGNFGSGNGAVTAEQNAAMRGLDLKPGGFLLALSASLFAYDGFAQATFVAAEVKNARKTLPRAILLATFSVAALYLLVTYADFHALPVAGLGTDVLQGDASVALEAAKAEVSDWFASGLAAAIIVSTFGTVNAYVLSSPRIYFSVARDGEFPKGFGHLSRFRTPTYGLVYGCIWAGLLTFSGGYDSLANLVVFALYVFYLLTMVGYVILRRRQPEAFTFKTGLGPLPPIVFAIASVAVLYSYLAKDIPNLVDIRGFGDVLANTSLLGVILIASGLGVYALMQRKKALDATS